MKLVNHKELHNEWMQDDEYRAAWQEEERKEKLRELLAEWRKHDNLTKAQVAERMGVTPPVISRLEKQHHQSQHRHTDPLRSRLRHQETCHCPVLNSQPSGAGLFVSVSPKILLKQV
jgi:predicted XRE-type DNA-binding protein